MNKLRLIEVPKRSREHYISDVGFIIFLISTSQSTSSAAVIPPFPLNKDQHEIVGYTELEDKNYLVIKNK